MGVLQPEGCLISEVTCVGDGHGPGNLERSRQVETSFEIAKLTACPEPSGVIGRHDVGVPELRDGPDLADEIVEHAGSLAIIFATHHFEHFSSAGTPLAGRN